MSFRNIDLYSAAIRRGFAVSMAVIALSALPAAAQDISKYPTVKNAGNYSLDWKSFYIASTERTLDVQREVKTELDLEYGADPKQKLDLYLPDDAQGKVPVMLFLHGGGFMEGDRAHYGYLAKPFTEAGVAVAVASYRLAIDGHGFPAPLDDTKRALIWLHENAGDYGYDGDQLFVSGHSAGGILAAEVAVDLRWLGEAGIDKSVLRGAIPISGMYNMRDRDLNDFIPTPESRIAASASLHVIDPAPAFLVALGGEEVTHRADSLELAHRVLYDGAQAQYLELADADHQEIVDALAVKSSPMFIETLRLIRSRSE